MSSPIRILVVEDDKTTLQQWEIEIETKNASGVDQDPTFTLQTATSYLDAKNKIENHDFDIAIVDINLKNPDDSAGNRDGNLVLNLILNSELAAVAVFSGESPGTAEPPDWATDVRIFSKGEGGITAVMSWVSDQGPMIEQIKLASKKIKKEMVKLFTRSIWPRWNNWITVDSEIKNSDFITDALTRHLTAHVYSEFLEKSEHKVHPEEWYFIPSIREGLRTGDLIKSPDGKIEILVTPRCDLARDGKGKNESFQLAECRDVSKDWNLICGKLKAAERAFVDNKDTSPVVVEELKKEFDKLKSQFRQFSQHKGNSSVFHFLPRVFLSEGKSMGPFFINFDKIRSVPRADAVAAKSLTAGKFAAITPEFLPSIIERLGSYFSRFGNPDYSHPE